MSESNLERIQNESNNLVENLLERVRAAFPQCVVNGGWSTERDQIHIHAIWRQSEDLYAYASCDNVQQVGIDVMIDQFRQILVERGMPDGV